MDLNTMTNPANNDMEALLASLREAEEAEIAESETEVPEGAEVIAAPAPVVVEDKPEAVTDATEEDLLAELSGIGEIAVPDEKTVTAQDALDEDLLADLEMATAKAEVYANQTSEAEVVTAAPVAAAATKPSKSRAAKAPSTPRTPRVKLEDLPDDTFQLYTSETPGPANKQVTLNARPTQVKVAEKFDNLFLSLHSAKAPSRYVVTGYKLLKANSTMTSADLIAAFLAEGLKDGTARSQTGQVLALFAAVGIANRSGQSLTVRSDSVIAAKLDAIIASA